MTPCPICHSSRILKVNPIRYIVASLYTMRKKSQFFDSKIISIPMAKFWFNSGIPTVRSEQHTHALTHLQYAQNWLFGFGANHFLWFVAHTHTFGHEHDHKRMYFRWIVLKSKVNFGKVIARFQMYAKRMRTRFDLKI